MILWMRVVVWVTNYGGLEEEWMNRSKSFAYCVLWESKQWQWSCLVLFQSWLYDNLLYYVTFLRWIRFVSMIACVTQLCKGVPRVKFFLNCQKIVKIITPRVKLFLHWQFKINSTLGVIILSNNFQKIVKILLKYCQYKVLLIL